MAVERMYEAGGGTRRRTSRSGAQARLSEPLAALTAAQQARTPSVPVPDLNLPPLPQLPPPQPVAVADPVAMLSRAVAGLPGLPTINTLQTLASLAESTASNLLQSRLAAQEQALQQVLGLQNLALDRARLALQQAELQQQAEQQQFERRQALQEREQSIRLFALQQASDIVANATDEESARNQLEILRSVMPELRYVLTDAVVEQMLRSKFGVPEAEEPSGGGSGAWNWMMGNLRSLPQSLARDLNTGRQLLSNLLHRLSFDYVMHGR